MESGPFEDVFPIEHGEIFQSAMLGLPGGVTALVGNLYLQMLSIGAGSLHLPASWGCAL